MMKGSSENKDEKDKNDEPSLSFSEGIDFYMDRLWEREQRKDMDINTVYDHYRKIESYIIPFFVKEKGNISLNKLTTDDIEEFYKYMRKLPNHTNPDEPLSETTIRNASVTLNAMLNYLKLKKKIKSNPCNNATNKPNPKATKKELNYFKKSEAIYAIKCLDRFANIRLKVFMNIIFSLGCRSEECAGIRWCDIDFDEAEVKYNDAITSHVPKYFLKSDKRVRAKKLKTQNSYRTNFLSDKVLNLLKQYYQFQVACGFEIKETDYIFRTWDAESNADPHKLSEEWRNFKKLYHIKNVDLHRIRHTVANILEKNGVPKKDIAKLLGNTERVLEEYYTHVDSDELRNMRNIIVDQLYSDVEYVDLDIDLVVKVLNDAPMNSLSEKELKILDYILDDTVTDNNYSFCLKTVKQQILNNDSKFMFFIDENQERLNTKIESYKMFSNGNVSVKKTKDVVITKDIFSL